MTFFSMFDVPVFWPILLLYWCLLFFVTMKRQIKHMIKYKYLPFSWGKKVGSGAVRGCTLELHAMLACTPTHLLVRPRPGGLGSK